MALAPATRAALHLARIGVPFTGALVLFPARMDSLFLGVLLATLVRQRHRLLAWITHPLALPCLVLAVIPLELYSPHRDLMASVLGYSAIALLCGAFLALAVERPLSLAARVTSWPWLRWVGVRAYGMYLFHRPVLGAVFGLFAGFLPKLTTPLTAWLILGSIPATVALAALSYRWIELPLLRLGHRFSYGGSPRTGNAGTGRT